MDHLLCQRVDRPEGIGEAGRLQAVVDEVVAVGAHRYSRVLLLELLDVRVVQRVTPDLVAGRGEVAELRPGHVRGVADDAGVHVEGGVHAVRVQDGERAVRVRVAVVELDRHDGLRGRSRRGGTHHQYQQGPGGKE